MVEAEARLLARVAEMAVARLKALGVETAACEVLRLRHRRAFRRIRVELVRVEAHVDLARERQVRDHRAETALAERAPRARDVEPDVDSEAGGGGAGVGHAQPNPWRTEIVPPRCSVHWAVCGWLESVGSIEW